MADRSGFQPLSEATAVEHSQAARQVEHGRGNSPAGAAKERIGAAVEARPSCAGRCGDGGGGALSSDAKLIAPSSPIRPLGRYVIASGARLHCVEKGRGLPLGLVDGKGVMLEDFLLSGVSELSAHRYRAPAFDCPGFGHRERSPGPPVDRQRAGLSPVPCLPTAWRRLAHHSRHGDHIAPERVLHAIDGVA